MTLAPIARIALPSHGPDVDFDHAVVDPIGDRLYVAHPGHDAVEVVDLSARRHLFTLGGLRGIAGVWLDPPSRRLFTSNRGEATASIFDIGSDRPAERHRVPTGARPNGLAYDADRGVLLVAGVGNPANPTDPPTLTFVDVRTGRRIGQVEMPGRTRWALYHRPTDSFYVNVADPPGISGIRAGALGEPPRTIPIPGRGPHGLEQDPSGRRLFCAADEGSLFSVDLAASHVERIGPLSGAPDVVWSDPARNRLFVAVGDPGAVDIYPLDGIGARQRLTTAVGAHTLTVDAARGELHVFLPETHEDLVFGGPPGPGGLGPGA